MDDNAKSKAQRRITAIAKALNPAEPATDLQRFMSRLRDTLLADPKLPPASPTRSLWQDPAHPTVASIQSATLPLLTDYAIIGSGITACSVAKALLENPENGFKVPHVTVLEARTLVSGATGRNGGHLVTAAGHTYGPLAKQHGEEAAKEITRFSIMNIDKIMSMVKEMDPKLQKECQIRNILKVMAVVDESLWEGVKESVLAFQHNVPEHKSLHRIIEKENVEKVRSYLKANHVL
jgi:hypothetical protein